MRLCGDHRWAGGKQQVWRSKNSGWNFDNAAVWNDGPDPSNSGTQKSTGLQVCDDLTGQFFDSAIV